MTVHNFYVQCRTYFPSSSSTKWLRIIVLQQELQKYLDDAPDGVIYFCMGSNLQSTLMPESKRNAFLGVFSKLKQRVLWKWESDTLPGQPSNVKLAKWLPQSDILGECLISWLISCCQSICLRCGLNKSKRNSFTITTHKRFTKGHRKHFCSCGFKISWWFCLDEKNMTAMWIWRFYSLCRWKL